MRPTYIKQDGVSHGIDFDAHYTVARWGHGIAFYLLGWKAEQEPLMCYDLDETGKETEVETGEWEEVPNYDYVVAVMVGDDRRHIVEVCDLIPLADDQFCRSCGQVGCRCNVYV